MAFVISRSSRISRYRCVSLYSSSLCIWRSDAAKSTIDSPFKVATRGNIFGVLSNFQRVFCSVPSSMPTSLISVKPESHLKKFWNVVVGSQISRIRLTEGNEMNSPGGKVIEDDGKTHICCHFSLTDHHGKPVTDEDYRGMWKLIYLGFTQCPDVSHIQKLVAAVDKIKAKGRIDVLPMFISVDPELDTVERVGEYVKAFHPKLIGLTGSREELTKVALAFQLFSLRALQPKDQYAFDAPSIVATFLLAPDMEILKFFGEKDTVEGLTDDVMKEIKHHKIKK